MKYSNFLTPPKDIFLSEGTLFFGLSFKIENILLSEFNLLIFFSFKPDVAVSVLFLF